MDLTFTEAWALWWSGQQLTDHTLYGAPVLWLGRAGKLLAFLAGTTIVLDVIGSERLTAWGNEVRGTKFRMRLFTSGLVAIQCFVPVALITTFTDWSIPPVLGWGAILVTGVGYVAMRWCDAIARFLGRALANRKCELVLRVTAIPLFFVGFTLDYLAS